LLVDKLIQHLRVRGTREALCESPVNDKTVMAVGTLVGICTEQILGIPRVFLTLNLGENRDIDIT